MNGSNDSDETQMDLEDIDIVNQSSFIKIITNTNPEEGEGMIDNSRNANTTTSLNFLSKQETMNSPRKVWSKGDCCLAPFSGDGEYYRAVIKKMYRQVNPFKVKVSYFGYESEEDEVISIDCLKPEYHDNSFDEAYRLTMATNVQSEWDRSCALAKEKDLYMRQKYESTDEEPTLNLTANQKKKKRFKRHSAHQTGSKHHQDLSPEKKIDCMPTEVKGRCRRSIKVAEKADKSEQNFQGFTDVDLEKPCFEIKPMTDKVPFCVSKEGASPQFIVPASINQYLRDYQRDGVRFIHKNYIQNQGCILGDDMGLGKTVQVIALIASIFDKTGTKEDAMPSYLKREMRKDDKLLPKGPFLIISPSSVLFNWEDELSTWGYFKTARFHGTSKKETLERAKRGKLEVVPTTYETFRIHIDYINQVNWLCIVMDEAHRIKEPSSQVTKAAKNIRSTCRIGLTGTPMQNNMEELWCLLDWANPDCLGSLETFTNEFVLPIKIGQRFDATKRELATARKKQQEFGLLKDKWILRRTKKLLIDQLPRKDERTVFAPLTELQFALYEHILEFPASKSVMKNGESCDCESRKARNACCYKLTKDEVKQHRKEIFHVITLLRKVSNHAALLLPYHKASEKQKQLALSICKKLFDKFPILKEVYRSGSFTKMSDIKFSGKLKIADRLLAATREGKDKVLIFSTSVQLLNILEAYVISKGYVYRRLDGDTKADTRTGIVREFNSNPDVFICLVSTKAGGVGLNFTGANVVIIFDPAWNPSFDNQAEDRAYRIGQHRNVRVYRLIAEGSIEENIYLRQIYKQQLSNAAVHKSNERRLFTAVAGLKSKQGELFGLKNLFKLRREASNFTNDLIKRTENIESGVRMVRYEIKPVASQDSEFQDTTTEEMLEGYECAASQNLDEFTSDIEENAVNSCNLFSEGEEEGGDEDFCKQGYQGSSNERRQSPSSDTEPPLKWKKSRRTSRRKSLTGKHFTAVNKHRKSQIKTTSDDDSSSDESAIKMKKKNVKRRVRFKEDAKEAEDPESLKLMDDVLDKCGVTYTSTAKKVMSTSLAEDRMTSEAIKDVFWHGMHSQEPAHFMDPSTSEESDDIPCLNEEKVSDHKESKADGCRTETKLEYTSLLSKRIFERIGSDMFLVGATPSLIRKKQFGEIASYYGFESSKDFAEVLMQSSEKEIKGKLYEFYKANEPQIVESSVFKSIFYESSSRREAKISEIRSTGCAAGIKSDKLSIRNRTGERNFRKGRYGRGDKGHRKTKRGFDLDLDSTKDMINVHEKDSSFEKQSKSQKEMGCSRVKASSPRDYTSVSARPKCEASYDNDIYSSSEAGSDIEAMAQESRDFVEETQIDMQGGHANLKVALGNKHTESSQGKDTVVVDKEDGTCLESSDDILHDMMFNAACSSLGAAKASTKTDDVLIQDCTEQGNDFTPESRSSSSILDELMGKSYCTQSMIETKKESNNTRAGELRSCSETCVDYSNKDSQNTVSVLDELMG